MGNSTGVDTALHTTCAHYSDTQQALIDTQWHLATPSEHQSRFQRYTTSQFLLSCTGYSEWSKFKQWRQCSTQSRRESPDWLTNHQLESKRVSCSQARRSCKRRLKPFNFPTSRPNIQMRKAIGWMLPQRGTILCD